MSERIQLSRKKGWRKPVDAVVVSRPSKWGNPYSLSRGEAGEATGTRQYLVNDFCHWLLHPHDRYERPGSFKAPKFETCAQSREARDLLLASLDDLRGFDLACWCPLSQPCHADVLLRLVEDKELLRSLDGMSYEAGIGILAGRWTLEEIKGHVA